MAKKVTATAKPESKVKKAIEAHREELQLSGLTLDDKQIEAIVKIVRASLS